ncbi:MAG: polysaccharide deacetylase family protein [Anaerolineae bacterium]|nr:polysaccharide deacetylase family protein [Anaerolineae bacterium]
MCQAINDAISHTLKTGVVCSTSLMTPCSHATQAMQWLRENPDMDFGVHLTVISDAPTNRYRPLTNRNNVPSLVDEAGYFYMQDRIPAFVAQVNIAELEMEFRAQIETVLAANLRPTHLDWHCMASGGSADIFNMTFRLAQAYGLAMRVADDPFIEQVQSRGLPCDDYALLDSYRLDTAGKAARYVQLLRELPAGLSEWAVHPGLQTAELVAIEPDSSDVRQADYDFVISPEARAIIQQEGIILLNYAPLQALWRSK